MVFVEERFTRSGVNSSMVTFTFSQQTSTSSLIFLSQLMIKACGDFREYSTISHAPMNEVDIDPLNPRGYVSCTMPIKDSTT